MIFDGSDEQYYISRAVWSGDPRKATLFAEKRTATRIMIIERECAHRFYARVIGIPWATQRHTK